MNYNGVRVAGTVAFVTLLAAPAGAACANKAEILAFQNSIGKAFACALRSIHDNDRPCATVAPPPCAAGEFAALLQLVGADPPEPFVRPAARCQRAIYKATRRFLHRRGAERLRERRRQDRSALAMNLDAACDTAIYRTSNGPQPRLGGACAALLDEPALVLKSGAVVRCIRPQIEGLLSSVLGLPLLQPNVILIVNDDQHPQAINAMPSTLAGIAAGGVRFANAFTTTPICAPSRAGILTGQRATTNGVIANGFPDSQGLPSNGALALDESTTLGALFRSAGYRTALFGKYMNSYQHISPQVPEGWDDWYAFVNDNDNFFDFELNENGNVVSYGSEPSDYSTDVIAGHARRFIEVNRDRPFFMVFAPFAPHHPSSPAPRHQGAMSGSPPWRPPSWGELDLSGRPSWFRFFAVAPPLLPSRDAAIQRQLESLLSVDEAIDALLRQLERRGLTDNTLIVFTADHGLLWGEHRWYNKQVGYEESIRVPLLIKYPVAVPAGHTEDTIALNIDIAPTLLHLAGVDEGDHRFDGEVLVPAPDPATWRADFAFHHFQGGYIIPPWEGLRTERYKYLRHSVPGDADELYDLLSDPFELTNLALDPAYASLIALLADRLDELIDGQ